VRFLRRRNFVVNRPLQVSILLTSLGYVALLILVISVALFAPLIIQLRHPDYESAETTDAALRILYLHEVYWLPVLLTLLFIALHSVRTSHRIAGPMYRFRRACESMKKLALPAPVRLRKHDYFRPEMDTVNSMIEAWRGFVTGVQRDSAALHDGLARYAILSKSAPAGAEAEAVWEDIVRTEQQLHEAVARVGFEGNAGSSRPGEGANAS
jgi:hypothetical protein